MKTETDVELFKAVGWKASLTGLKSCNLKGLNFSDELLYKGF